MTTRADIETRLRRAISQDRLAHAYLLCGSTEQERGAIGRDVAMDANCHTTPGNHCGACLACEKIQQDVHPDVIELHGEGASGAIPIAMIRERLLPRLGMPPHEGNLRVIIIADASRLLGPAANALLKTLEEPPARTHFWLGTDNIDRLLPTIRSRCVRLDMARTSEDDEDATNLATAFAGVVGDHASVAKLASEHKDRALWADALAIHAAALRSELLDTLDAPRERSLVATLAEISQTIDRLRTSNVNLGLALDHLSSLEAARV